MRLSVSVTEVGSDIINCQRSTPSSFLTKRSTPSGGFLKEKEYSFLTKRSTPFGQFVEQKEYSFCSIFGAKGVLV